MDKLNLRRVSHNKIQQHKGKFGKYMPLKEIQNHIDYIETFELDANCKSLLEYYKRQKTKALQILEEKTDEVS
jgi:hypothetical protein|tara:strand:- start:5356 stop:5574 length:219 start_codon:yes stop_codon:yes gene_type:complete